MDENGNYLLFQAPWQYQKLLDEIARKFDVTLIDAVEISGAAPAQNDEGRFYLRLGGEGKGYTAAITKAVDLKGADILGEYGCYGFNTFGPFKLIGGIAKGHPNQAERTGAVEFFEGIMR